MSSPCVRGSRGALYSVNYWWPLVIVSGMNGIGSIVIDQPVIIGNNGSSRWSLGTWRVRGNNSFAHATITKLLNDSRRCHFCHFQCQNSKVLLLKCILLCLGLTLLSQKPHAKNITTKCALLPIFLFDSQTKYMEF